ncbi:MAG: hypothetical protein KC983_07050 [Phycisphaerales bacterium]|nr:hypothetical protein [Phycisphaerales bacterium]
MKRLNATQRNDVWSWCAIDDDGRRVYLSLWSDMRAFRDGDGDRASYIVQEASWGNDPSTGTVSPARADHDEKLARVFDDGYEAFGYIIETDDPAATPRSITRTKTSFIFQLELERKPDMILGYPTKRIEVTSRTGAG